MDSRRWNTEADVRVVLRQGGVRGYEPKLLNAENIPVHGIDITPSMRQEATTMRVVLFQSEASGSGYNAASSPEIRHGKNGTGKAAVGRFVVDPSTRGGDYHAAITEAQRTHPNGAAVEVKHVGFHQDPGTKLFLAPDASAGVAVSSSGDLVSVFKKPGSTVRIGDILAEASQHATTLDCFVRARSLITSAIRPRAR
jgi:hypothetical protein